MPCDSGPMEYPAHEVYNRRTAQCYATLLAFRDSHVPAPIMQEIERGNVDYTRVMCEAIKGLIATESREPSAGSAWGVFASRAPFSREVRAVLDWWEDHQKVDAARAAHAARLKTQEETRKAALAKLTHDERHALGL